jgi:exodeoxyribonuclease V alpha subunit
MPSFSLDQVDAFWKASMSPGDTTDLWDQLRDFEHYLGNRGFDRNRLNVLSEAADVLRNCAKCFRFRADVVEDINRMGIAGVQTRDLDSLMRHVIDNNLTYEAFREFPLKVIKEVAWIDVNTGMWHMLETLSKGMGVQQRDIDIEYLDSVMQGVMREYGHMCLPFTVVKGILAAKNRSMDCEKMIDDNPDKFVKITEGAEFVYRVDDFREERFMASKLRTIAFHDTDEDDDDDCEIPLPDKLSEEQRTAVSCILGADRATVVTGFPGTGKTTVVAAVVKGFTDTFGCISDCLFLAPTGKAAARLKRSLEDEGFEETAVMTIHRALTPRNAPSISGMGLIVIDEMSMVPSSLFHKLLTYCSNDVRLLLLGDPDQLPSIERGDVFSQLISPESGLRVVRLTKNFRQQGKGLAIWRLAQAIRDNERYTMSMMTNESITWVDTSDSKEILSAVVKAYREHEGALQILVPVNGGECGVFNLNAAIHASEHGLIKDQHIPSDAQVRKLIRYDDKVLITKNGKDKFDKPYFNGMLGRAVDVDADSAEITVLDEEDDEEVTVPSEDVTLGHCLSIHRSQGSEYKSVAIILHPSHGRSLTRETAYTAVTRAKDKLYVFASREALKMAKRCTRERRYSLLTKFLSRA